MTRINFTVNSPNILVANSTYARFKMLFKVIKIDSIEAIIFVVAITRLRSLCPLTPKLRAYAL